MATNDPTDLTKYPVPSTSFVPAARNASDFDRIVNGEAGETVVNRVGGTLKNLATQNSDFDNQLAEQQVDFDNQLATQNSDFDNQLAEQQVDFEQSMALYVASAGCTIVGDFANGVSLAARNEAVYYAGDPLDNNANEAFYVWNGTYPKTVAPGTSPFDEAGWLLAATGYTKQSGAIQLMGQTIDIDVTIPVNQNGFSVSPTVSDGVTVTVSSGSIWAVIDGQ